MSWQVQWTNRALRATSKFDRPTRMRIINGVEALANTGQGDVKHLKGAKQDLFRLRIGGWRIIFSRETEKTLVIRTIRPRGDVY